MSVQVKNGLGNSIEGLEGTCENFSVEDYIAENLDKNNVRQVSQVADILGNSGLEEIAEKLHIGIARYRKQQTK